jgi:transcriptional regulator with XRE-family HTH domain
MKIETTIGLVREKMSITQQALADYLLIHRSILNMAERGERSLPASMRLELALLLQGLENFESADSNDNCPSPTNQRTGFQATATPNNSGRETNPTGKCPESCQVFTIFRKTS